MKYSELIAELKNAGCYFVRHGADHDIWYSPITNRHFPLPGHQSRETAKGTERAIKKMAGI